MFLTIIQIYIMLSAKLKKLETIFEIKKWNTF